MMALGSLRLLGGLGGLALAAAAAIWLAGLMKKAREVDGWRACAAAAATIDRPLDACSGMIAGRVETARRADACEKALAGQRLHGTELYAIRAACGAEVKQLHAQADALADELVDARAQIASASADRAAAVARAESRAAINADRKAANDRTLNALRPGADGRIRCDADCLLALDTHAPADRR